MFRTRLARGPRFAAAALCVALSVSGCGKKEEPAAGGPPGAAKRPAVPVAAQKAETRDFPVDIRAIGTVEATQSAPVRAQVGGAVTAVFFREGENVRAGQTLFQIDPRPIEAQIRQIEADRVRWDAQTRTAEAQLAALEAQAKTAEAQARAAEASSKTAEAQAALAAAEAERYSGLVAKDYVTREQYDQFRTGAQAAQSNLTASRSSAEAVKSSAEAAKSSVLAAKAAVESAKASRAASDAALENARVQLGYATIRSPVSGQAGSLLVKLGDYVKGNGDTLLVSVNQIQPILARFTVPEKDIPAVQRYGREGKLPVRVDLPGGGTREGQLVFMDNAVDRATGTIALKARFDNADSALWPGQFVNLSVSLYTLRGVVAVPDSAVQVGQKGPYAYVVDAEGTALFRPVKPGLTADGWTVVEDGVKAGETVVTDGHLRLTPGAKVQLKAAPGAPGAPAAAPAPAAGGAAK